MTAKGLLVAFIAAVFAAPALAQDGPVRGGTGVMFCRTRRPRKLLFTSGKLCTETESR